MLNNTFTYEPYNISKSYRPNSIPNGIELFTEASGFKNKHLILLIIILSFVYKNGFFPFKIPYSTLQKLPERPSKDLIKKVISYLKEQKIIRIHTKSFHNAKTKKSKATIYEANPLFIKQILLDTDYIYKSKTINTKKKDKKGKLIFKNVKGQTALDKILQKRKPRTRQRFINFSDKDIELKKALKDFRIYAKPVKVFDILNDSDLAPAYKQMKWHAFLSTGTLTGYNIPDFKISKKCGRLSTARPNLQGIPKIFRNSLVFPEITNDVDYTGQHLYIAISQNTNEAPTGYIWDVLEDITGLKKAIVKQIVNAYFFGQSGHQYYLHCKDKNDGLVNYKETIGEHNKVMSALEKINAKPKDKSALMKTGARIMENIIKEFKNDFIEPIYDGVITNCQRTANNLLDKMPLIAKNECGIFIPVKNTNLQTI